MAHRPNIYRYIQTYIQHYNTKNRFIYNNTKGNSRPLRSKWARESHKAPPLTLEYGKERRAPNLRVTGPNSKKEIAARKSKIP